MTALFTLLCFICVLNVSQASVTVYHQVPLGQSTQTAAGANYTGAAAYDPTVLNPPAVPDTPTTQFALELQSSSQAVQGISIMQSGAFLGFSIETSVINQVRKCISVLEHRFGIKIWQLFRQLGSIRRWTCQNLES
jgi:hypothetical protein